MAAPIYSNGIANVQIEGDVVLVEATFETDDKSEVVATVAFTRHAALLMANRVILKAPTKGGAEVVPIRTAGQ
jgi:hypothetical protein